MALIRQSVVSEELVRRTRAEILADLDDYWVLEIDRNLIGCVAVHLYPEEKQAELACLYVNKSSEGEGYGRKLMSFAEQLAAEKGMRQLFALSTQAFTYFQSKAGFVEGSTEDLPPSRREKYEQSGRNSKILVKKLLKAPSTETARSVVV